MRQHKYLGLPGWEEGTTNVSRYNKSIRTRKRLNNTREAEELQIKRLQPKAFLPEFKLPRHWQRTKGRNRNKKAKHNNNEEMQFGVAENCVCFRLNGIISKNGTKRSVLGR